eukprot:9495626-Pyramimonas_sp.AAC.1
MWAKVAQQILPFLFQKEIAPPPSLRFLGGARRARVPKMAQDGSKRASDAPRWPPRWLKEKADHGSRWLKR